MFQPNYHYGNQAHIPYAIGTLAAYAWHNPEIKENYCLKKLFFLRDDINETVGKLENPFLAAFSTYIWNFTYNITMAKAIKEAFPECIIVFGGHQIAPDSSNLSDYDFIDIIIQGEGEEPFLRLLRSYIWFTGKTGKPSPQNGNTIIIRITPPLILKELSSLFLRNTPTRNSSFFMRATAAARITALSVTGEL